MLLHVQGENNFIAVIERTMLSGKERQGLFALVG